MIWTETHLKIIQILTQSDPRSRKEIALEIGFSNPKSITKHLEYLQRTRYIAPTIGPSSNPMYQLNRDVDAMLHLYNNRHYRSIQEDIRAMDWFILALTKEYNELPEPLYMILLAMAKKSPTFFDNLVISRTPHELRERFRFMLFPFSFIVGMQENWEVPLLIHQLYAEAIARDMKGGRLVDGFCEPLKEIRQWIAERMKSQQE